MDRVAKSLWDMVLVKKKKNGRTLLVKMAYISFGNVILKYENVCLSFGLKYFPDIIYMYIS